MGSGGALRSRGGTKTPSRLISTAWAATLVASCVGRSVEIPSAPPTTPRPARHAARVAILPLDDVRAVEEAPDRAGLYVYRGREFRGTNLDWLRPSPMDHVTRRFAESLLRTGLFGELVLVRGLERRRDFDLVLRGAVRRARGYVEKDPPDGADPWVLAEVMIEGLRLEDAITGEARFVGATGWSVWERRPDPVDPWAVLGETMDRAVARLRPVLEDADFETFTVEPSVSLFDPRSERARDVPPGWRLVDTSTGSRPRGWTGEKRCLTTTYAQRQALSFHRLLGPYVPSVETWRCPPDVHLTWSRRAEWPAVLLGVDPSGQWIFASALGRSNWVDPLDELRRAKSVRPPPDPYVVEIEAGKPRPIGPEPSEGRRRR